MPYIRALYGWCMFTSSYWYHRLTPNLKKACKDRKANLMYLIKTECWVFLWHTCIRNSVNASLKPAVKREGQQKRHRTAVTVYCHFCFFFWRKFGWVTNESLVGEVVTLLYSPLDCGHWLATDLMNIDTSESQNWDDFELDLTGLKIVSHQNMLWLIRREKNINVDNGKGNTTDTITPYRQLQYISISNNFIINSLI